MRDGKGGGGRTVGEGHVRARLGEVEPDLRVVDFGVVDRHVRALRKEVPHERDCRRLARIASVRLEGKSEDSDTLPKSDRYQ